MSASRTSTDATCRNLSDDALWSAYRASRSLADRNRLVERYASFVAALAKRKHKRMPKPCPYDPGDFTAAGIFGLIASIERYKGGPKFTTYAWRAINGAMTEWLRNAVCYRKRRKSWVAFLQLEREHEIIATTPDTAVEDRDECEALLACASPRDRIIMRGLMDSRSTRDIARDCDVQPETVIDRLARLRRTHQTSRRPIR